MAAKPFIYQLAIDEVGNLPAEAAPVLQAWATKVALMRTLLDKAAHQQANAGLFRKFYDTRTPFSDRFVQLASCEQRPLDSNASYTEPGADASSANVVTYSIGHLFLQVGLCDPSDQRWKATTLKMLAAPRVASAGRIRQLRLGRVYEAGPSLSASETYLFREIHALTGATLFLGSPLEHSLG